MSKFITIFALFFTLNIGVAQASFGDKAYSLPQLKDVLKVMGNPVEKSLDPNHIDILVWNIYKGDKPNWKRDYLKLTSGKDILLVQEMFLRDSMANVFNSHQGFEYNAATSFLMDLIPTGVTTAANVAPSVVHFQRSRTREPIINTPKMAILTYYPIEGSEKELLVVNIHAVNFVSVMGLGRQIDDLANEIKDYKGPMIFAGDFNTWSVGKYQRVKRVMDKLGMKEASFSPDTRMRTLGEILDHVFYKGLDITHTRVYGDIDGSDHKAMEVSFKYNL